eukprot:TCONS_00025286-protein
MHAPCKPCLPWLQTELVHGVKFVMKGDKLDERDNVLIILNHRCRVDWMFYWMAVLRTGRLHNEKIIMKNELKHIPGPGWCMQYLLYCFLQRKWETDRGYLERYVNYFIDAKYPLQFFLFPEGTDFDKNGKASSDRFADKMGLPKYDYVMHPRTTGFNYLVQKTRGKVINTVYDVTLGYPVNLCYGEMDLARGNFPKEIHCFFKRYQVDELPTEDGALGDWCKERFAEKEERLKEFYKQKRFTGPGTEQDVTTRKQEDHANITNYISLIFWVSFVLYSIQAVWCSSFLFWYTIIVSIIHAVISAVGGMDKTFLDLHEKEKSKQR